MGRPRELRMRYMTERYFACAFVAFLCLSLIASRARRSARSLAVSRRVACSLVSYSEAAFTRSCFSRNKRSARSFAVKGIINRWVAELS